MLTSQDSNYLLLDEPFFSLDIKLKITLINLIVTKKTGKTIIFVTHDIDEALMLSDRIILLKNGEICFDYNVDIPLINRKYGKQEKERELLIQAQLK